MSLPYSFDSRLIIRTPFLPLPHRIDQVDFNSLLTDDNFLEAVYLASPVLYQECIKWREGLIVNKKDVEKLMRAISKYFLRMSSRCTPFGLFSGCAIAEWKDTGTGLALDSKKTGRHTRLDMHYLCALAKSLSATPLIKDKLLFFPNNSIYRIGNELRYVEYSYIEGSRHYRISSVIASDYLMKIMEYSATGVTIGQILLTMEDIPAEDASAFINELLDAQLLINELEPAITGQEYMDQIITVLERISSGEDGGGIHQLQSLREVRVILNHMDEHRHNTNIPQYAKIIEILAGLGVEYSEGKLFQVDLMRDLQHKGLKNAIQTQLLEALIVLNKLTPSKGNETLQTFARRFSQRYEDKEMPLMEVLDMEMGIGYQEETGSYMSPLVEDLQLSSGATEQKLAWSRLEMLLNEKLKDSLGKGLYSFELMDKELEKFSSDDSNLPPSLSVMFRIVDDNTIYIEGAGGSSAVNMLGRFAHADTRICELARDIARHEQDQDPAVIYAEIIHLPESRTGNILLHPAFRNYEIPYLAQSSLDDQSQLDVSDLFVSVRKGKVILRSRRLDKQVIPRLSTAHNYSFDSLPVYQFLCDLQLQDKKQGLAFSWGSLQYQNKFLPRVTYKNTVLNRARWSFVKTDIECLRDQTGEDLKNAVDAFRNKWRMPQHVVLSEGDNELLIDLDNIQMVQLLLDSIRQKETFIIKEFLWPDKVVKDENDATYANQFLAVLTKNGHSYGHAAAQRLFTHPHQREKREFTLGTEWVYFKLYCGVKSADKILVEAISPMVSELSAGNLIDKWFFIRYNDPDFHIRLRFHLKDIDSLGHLIRTVYLHLKEFESKGYIWKLQTDTYKREIERYGSNAVGLAESLFHFDSIACLGMLRNTEGDERETVKWIWGLRAIEDLLNCFGLSDHDKLSLLTDLRDAFGAEFNVDKLVRMQLNEKYRSNKRMIDDVMRCPDSLADGWQVLIRILEQKSTHILLVADEIKKLYTEDQMEIPLPALLSSYIHMMLNRIITAGPRMHELVIYDFLLRYYRSRMAAGQKNKTIEKDIVTKEAFILTND